MAKLFMNKRSGYILNVSTVGLAQQVKQQRVMDYLSPVKKAVVVLLIAIITGLGAISGFMAVNQATSTSASADILEDWMCKKNDDNNNPFVRIGGATDSMKATYLSTQLFAGISDMAPVEDKANGKNGWTEYGAQLYPIFDSWTGNYATNDEEKFFGTKGNANFGKTDGVVLAANDTPVKEAKSVPLYAHGWSDCVSPQRGFGNSFANFIFAIPKVTILATASLYGFAFENAAITSDTSVLHPITDALTELIVGSGGNPGLKDSLFLPFLTPIIMIGAISVFWVGIVKRSSTAALQSAVWMILATIAGLLFLSKPLWIPEQADNIVSTVTGAVTSAIIGDPTAAKLCDLPDSGDQAKQNSIIVDEVKCSIWYNAIYTPWVTGQFGESVNTLTTNPAMTSDPRGMLTGTIPLAGKDIAVDNWPLYHLVNQNQRDSYNLSEVAYAQLSGTIDLSNADAAHSNGVWAGNSPDAPIGMAFLSLIASLSMGLMLIVSSFALIGYQFTMIFLIILSPLFFLVGAAPGWGKRIAMRWAELIVVLVIKRIVVSLLVAVFLKFYSLIMNLTQLDYIFQLLLVMIITYVSLTQRAKIMSLFTDSIDFGGNKNINMAGGEGLKKFGAAAVGAGIGAIGASMGAQALTGSAVSGILGATGGGDDVVGGATEPTPKTRNNRSSTNTAPAVVVPRTVTTPESSNEPNENQPENGALPTRANAGLPTREDPDATKLIVLPGSDEAKAKAVEEEKKTDPTAITRPAVDVDKLNKEYRKKAIKQGAIAGLQQGLVAGKITTGMAFSASERGFSIGDGKHDNEVAKLEATGRTARDEQMLALFGTQVAEQRKAEVTASEQAARQTEAQTQNWERQQEAEERRHQERLAATNNSRMPQRPPAFPGSNTPPAFPAAPAPVAPMVAPAPRSTPAANSAGNKYTPEQIATQNARKAAQEKQIERTKAEVAKRNNQPPKRGN